MQRRVRAIRFRLLQARHTRLLSVNLAAWGLFFLLAATPPATAQDVEPEPAIEPAAQTSSAPSSAVAAEQPDLPTAVTMYWGWVLLPAAVAIVLAIALRQVIPALTIGVLVAGYMIVPTLAEAEVPGGTGWFMLIFAGLRLAVEKYLVGAMTDEGHVKILLFSLTIGGMVGVIAANGGTHAVVQRFSKWATSRERGQVVTWFAGLLVFFDDYANAMIVGPTMRPMCDRLRISRAKLAYIVDSTAAPVSSIALVGTWVGAEVGYIGDGLNYLKEQATMPTFLASVEPFTVLWKSIPYRFYAVLALVMVFLVGMLGRDFGPMKKAERLAPEPVGPDESETGTGHTEKVGRAWYAVAPVLVLVGVTLALLGCSGWVSVHEAAKAAGEAAPTGWSLIRAVAGQSDAYNSILYGALAGIVSAVVISIGTRALKLSEAVEGATSTMARMFPTFIVLVLAWTLAGAMEDLHVATVAKVLLQEAGFNVIWLPLLVFISSCVVSFATGTSWGTMGILCPLAVSLSATMVADQVAAGAIDATQAMTVFYATVGSVLAGSVFGDHCSPISDTTVLSSLATECPLDEHVWTQMPYAIVVAVVSMLCGDVLCRYYEQPVWVGLLAGTATLFLIVLVVGRKPNYAAAAAPSGG